MSRKRKKDLVVIPQDRLAEHHVAIDGLTDLPPEYDHPLNRQAITTMLPPYEPPLTAERVAIAIADEFERRGLAIRKEL